MKTIFDKIPPLSKVEKCKELITISCEPGMDVVKKAILKFQEHFIFKTFVMNDEKTTFTMIKKIDSFSKQVQVILNDVPKYLNIYEKSVSFSEHPHEGVELKHLFKFIKGFVCSKDKYFIHPRGNYYVLVDETKVERYIYLPEYPCCIKEFNEHVEKYKDDLMMNKIENWFTWYDCSDIKEFEKNYNSDFILYDTKTKKAFIKSSVHFSNRFICLIPLHINIDLKKVVERINNSEPTSTQLKTITY